MTPAPASSIDVTPDQSGSPGSSAFIRSRIARTAPLPPAPRVTLVDGSFHDVDSSEMAFKVAGSMALRDAARRAKPVLLEPIMAVEVVTPEEFMGDVIGDLNRRRGRIEGMEPRGNAQVVRAFVPLAEMFGYATDLRSQTQGRATYSMEFSRYTEVPQSIANELIAKSKS